MILKEYVKNYLDNLNLDINEYKDDVYKLIAYINNIKYQKIFFILDNDINDKEIERYNNVLDRYFVEKEPLQYIIGKWNFYNEEYIVNSNVLIPRPDTEILVETAISYINKNNFKSCLDMCCGSGCVGISISKNSSIKSVDLVDISQKALNVTKQNIEKNNAEKCKYINSNLFSNIDKNIKYDIIVSNPPYIPSNDILMLSDYVKKEPVLALDGGNDGLYIYNKFFRQCIDYLNDNGYIIVEIGFNQKDDIINIVNDIKELDYIECKKDYGNNERVIVCRFHQK